MTEASQETQPKGISEDVNNDKFIEDLEDLLKQYGVQGHAGVFLRKGAPIIIFGPDVIKGTKLLNMAHAKCRSEVLKLIGE